MKKANSTLFKHGLGVLLLASLYVLSPTTLKAQCTLVCNNLVQVSLDQNCEAEILPDDILEGGNSNCPNGILQVQAKINGVWTPASGNFVATSSNINQTLQVRVRDLVSGNSCSGYIHVEDKLAPVLTCEELFLNCAITDYSPDYLLNELDIDHAYPSVEENCGTYTLSHIDTYFDLPCNGSINGYTDISAYVIRKWTAVDGSGNSATCNQYIYFERRHASDVIYPSDITVSCENPITDPASTGVPHISAFGIDWPLWPSSALCELAATYQDNFIYLCDGTTKILRTWTVLDWCLPSGPNNPVVYVQVIKVEDDVPPVVNCPADNTISTNPNDCHADTDLPDIIVSDACSRMATFEAQWTDYNGFGQSLFGSFSTFPGNNLWDPDTLAVMGYANDLPIGDNLITYILTDDCGNSTVCQFTLTVIDDVPPNASCDQTTVVAIGPDDPQDCYTSTSNCNGAGVTWVKATTFNDGSYDECANIKFSIRRMAPYSDCINNLSHDPCYPDGKSEFDIATGEADSIKFYCCESGTTQTVILRVYQLNWDGTLSIGWDGEPIYNECMIQVEVQDKIKPQCVPPANVTVACENFDPSLWLYGKPTVTDNCCLDTSKVYQGQCGLTHTVNYSQFDTVCNRGTITRRFTAYDCTGLSSQCTQRIVVNYHQDYYIKFPNDTIVSVCNGTPTYGEPKFFGENCELLGVSYEDAIFSVVDTGCYKVERTWKIINWCTYDPNQPCVYVPNPNPNPISNNKANLPGPIVSPIQTPGDPWKSTIVKVTPFGDPVNYSMFYDPDANCYTYKQIIKVIDGTAPVITCPPSPTTICDVTANDPDLWNASYWWDNATQSHDLCEAPSDICVTATDACSGANINIEYQLFLDLDGDGVMETVVNSTNLGSQPGGLGWNNVLFGNLSGPGQSRTFDNRPVPTNQKWGFAIQETVSGVNKTACVRFNTQQNQSTYVTPQLPYGVHKIKWFVSDGCGNEKVCEYNIVIKDCKAPTVVCLNGLSVNIMPTGMIQLWATDFLQYASDNCTPTPYLKYAVRKSGTGTGFPVDAQGNPITSVTFDCTEIGTQLVELWAIDLAGNADYCETYILVQDNNDVCGITEPALLVSGALKTDNNDGVEGATVYVNGTTDFTPPFSMFDLSDAGGYYSLHYVPVSADFTIAPEKDDNLLNGVTTYDLVLISKHILGIQPLNTPYKMIAADANKSNSVTTLDIIELRKLLLGINQQLPNNTSWRFVDKSQVFSNPANPFADQIRESISVADALTDQPDKNFVGIKIGDVNNSALANGLMNSGDRTAGALLLDVADRTVKAGEEFELTFQPSENVAGYQFTLNLDGLEPLGVVASGKVTADNFGLFKDAVTGSIDDASPFTLKFRAVKAGKTGNMLSVSNRITTAEAYREQSNNVSRLEVALRFNSAAGSVVSGVGYELLQNVPNPVSAMTSISFSLPAAAEATLTITNAEGKVLKTIQGSYAKGLNTVILHRDELQSGILFYQLESGDFSAVKKMIIAQ